GGRRSPTDRTPLWNLVELDLVLREPRHDEDVALRIDTDVRRPGHVLDQRRHGAVFQDVHRAIGPTRHEDAPVGKNLDAIVLAGAGSKRRSALVTGLPSQNARSTKRSDEETAIGAIPRDSVGCGQGI